MLGELLGEVVGWVIGEILGEAVFEGLRWLVPKRITGFGLIAWWFLSLGAGWYAVAWWMADAASAARAGITLVACWVLATSGIMLTLAYDHAVQERRRAAPVSRIAVSAARPRRW